MKRRFFRGLIRLIRPYWWGKTLFYMTLGACIAVDGVPDLSTFFFGFLIICLLRGGIYTLNDLSDMKMDKYDNEKKNRSFVSNMVSPKEGLVFASLLIIFALISGFVINKLFEYFPE